MDPKYAAVGSKVGGLGSRVCLWPQLSSILFGDAMVPIIE